MSNFNYAARRKSSTPVLYIRASIQSLSTSSLFRQPQAAVLAVVLLGLVGSSTPAAGQDMPRVRRTIQDLTAPSMQGRGYVRRGDQKAAEYIRRRFRRLYLQELSPNYTQSFQLDVNTFPGELKLKIDSSLGMLHLPIFGGYHRLQPGLDFIAAPGSGAGRVGGSFSAAAVIPLDTTVFSDSSTQQRILHRPWNGNGIVVNARHARQLSTLPAPLRQHLDSAAFMLTVVPKLTASLTNQQDRQIKLDILESAWLKSTKHSSSATSASVPTYVALRVDAKLEQKYQTQNVVGYVPGQIHPDSFLVVTAHYDHLGTMGRRTYFPGANDNASGTAMLLELAAYYARPENKPAYSVVFIAFGAEEAGLVGSTYFVSNPLIPLERIRFLVNLDLLGTGSEGVTVVNGRELPVPFQLLQRLNETSKAVPSLAARGRAANSDHFPFSERGVPTFFLYTRGGITAYHDVQDRAETLPLTAFANVFGLIRSFLDSLGAR